MAEDPVVCIALGLEKLENITLIRKATVSEMGEVCQYPFSELFASAKVVGPRVGDLRIGAVHLRLFLGLFLVVSPESDL